MSPYTREFLDAPHIFISEFQFLNKIIIFLFLSNVIILYGTPCTNNLEILTKTRITKDVISINFEQFIKKKNFLSFFFNNVSSFFRLCGKKREEK